ncbi:MAG: redox-regulated ATPase YchF [Anaerolineae bacterium]|nr:MAG: redox-regulated ATPase YchF [Anaerolineae bacterium]
MRLGIIGFPQSGKTTLFNALTGENRPVHLGGGRLETQLAVVNVPDDRLDRLAALFRPQKVTPAKVAFTDIGGLESGAAQKGLPGALLNQLSSMDGFVHVLRCFEEARVPHSLGSVDARRDWKQMEAEFMLYDLLIIERRLERLNEELRKGGGRPRSEIEREQGLLERLRQSLEAEQPLRRLNLDDEQHRLISSFAFLSLKPTLLVLNLGEGQPPPPWQAEHPAEAVIALQGKLEMELAQMPPDEAQVFQEMYGIQELSLPRLIRQAYALLGLQTFFTVGEDEVRAWQVRRGATAQEAAGVIHTDLMRGFIRAEVIGYKELLEAGGWNEARAKGWIRLEGKDYRLQEGEIMHVRAAA